jgi:hypothetical protein
MLGQAIIPDFDSTLRVATIQRLHIAIVALLVKNWNTITAHWQTNALV